MVVQFNLAHGPETKNKDKNKIKNRVAQKKRSKQKSVEAVRRKEVKLRGGFDLTGSGRLKYVASAARVADSVDELAASNKMTK